jgi:hypothetical protein
MPAVPSVFKRFLSAFNDAGKLAFFNDNVSFFFDVVFGSDDKADCPHKTLLAMMVADCECCLSNVLLVIVC